MEEEKKSTSSSRIRIKGHGLRERRDVQAKLRMTFISLWGPSQVMQLQRAITNGVDSAARADAAPNNGGLRAQAQLDQGKVDKLTRRKEESQQILLNAIAPEDQARLYKMREFSASLASGDPESVVVAILKIMGKGIKETAFEHAADLAIHTEDSSAEEQQDLLQHFEDHRDRVYHFPGLLFNGEAMPGERTEDEMEFIDRYNENLTNILCLMSVSGTTHDARRRMESRTDENYLAALPFDDYALKLQNFCYKDEAADSKATILHAKGGKRDRSQVKCYECNEFGHYAKYCPSKSESPADGPAKSTAAKKEPAAAVMTPTEYKALTSEMKEIRQMLALRNERDEAASASFAAALAVGSQGDDDEE